MRVGGIDVARGERRRIDLFAARLYTHSELEIPVQVVRGRRDGPRLVVCAALHGDEINGVEVIRRVLRIPKLEEKLRGTLIAVPIVNVFGFIEQSRYLPDRRDLNRSFPGSPKGSLASQMARLFLDEVINGSDAVIDLHTGSHDRCNLPQLRVSPADAEGMRLGRAFGPPVILTNRPARGTLRDAAVRRGTPALVYEAGQALRFEDEAVRPGLEGIKRVMRELGMLPKLRKKKVIESLVATRSTWIRAPTSGVFHVENKLGSRVKKKDVVGTISDPFGVEETLVRATASGLIIGRLERPLVHRGDALIHLARLEVPAGSSPKAQKTPKTPKTREPEEPEEPEKPEKPEKTQGPEETRKTPGKSRTRKSPTKKAAKVAKAPTKKTTKASAASEASPRSSEAGGSRAAAESDEELGSES